MSSNEDRPAQMVTVSCPHCAFSRPLPAGTIPAGARVTCPRCQGTFVFGEEAAAPLMLSPGTVAPEPEPLAAAVPRPRPPAPRTMRFTFSGTAREFFGIWIVNTLLKIVTLGVYSAWAKVRKRRYLYGNTMLHGAPFDYLANPRVLFRGWLIGVLALLLYTVGSRYSPTVASLSGLLFLLVMPWLVVRSRLFNLRNSSYRNIRFNFRADYREAYVVFAGLYLLLPFTLGLLFPYIVYRQKKFLVEQSDYGKTPFVFAGSAGDFYQLYLKALGMLILLGGAIFLTLFALGASLSFTGRPTGAPQALVVLPVVVLPLAYFVIAIYVQTAQANLVWGKTSIAGNRLACTLRTGEMVWLYLSNAVAILCTLGMLIPWATVRLTRYRFDNLTLAARDELEGFVAASQAEVSAAGEEIGDLFGIDIAL